MLSKIRRLGMPRTRSSTDQIVTKRRGAEVELQLRRADTAGLQEVGDQ